MFNDYFSRHAVEFTQLIAAEERTADEFVSPINLFVFNNKGCFISSFYRVDHEYQVRLELRVLVVSNNSLAKVEFWTASRPEDGIFLCELHLPIPVSYIYIYIYTLYLALQLRHHSFPQNYLLKPSFHMIVRIASWRLVNVRRNTRLVKSISVRSSTYPTLVSSHLGYASQV